MVIVRFFKFVFVLLVVPHSSAQTCFGEHFCCPTFDYRHANHNCTLKNVQSFTDLTFNRDFNSYKEYYYGLTCQNVTLKELPDKFFSYFPRIQILDGSSIGLESIERDNFKNAGSIRNLTLADNNIAVLGNMVFFYLKNLVELNLKSNQISTIKSGAFDDCSKSLTTLNLADNKLKSISAEVLDSLGHFLTCSVNLSSNRIASIDETSTNLETVFRSIDLSNNSLTTFTYVFDEVNVLDLSKNNLQGELSFLNQRVSILDLSNNNLTRVKVDDIRAIDMSNNIFLNQFSLANSSELIMMRMRNVNLDKSSGFELMRHMTTLQILDLSYSHIGPLKVDDFAEMTSLRELYLKQTGISRVTFGTFSHLKNLSVLDVSDNALGSFDVQILSGLMDLAELDIGGNNLTKLDGYSTLKSSFPNLEKIGLENSWNCSYLAQMFKSLNMQNILVKDPEAPVKNSSNIFGIGCTTEEQTAIDKVNAGGNFSDKVADKLNEIIEKINDDKSKRESLQLDYEVLKSENFKLKSDLLDVKSQLSRLLLSTTSSSNNSNLDVKEFRTIVDQLNAVTLDKQKLASDKIEHRINELQLEMAKDRIESQKFMLRSEVGKMIQSDNGERADKFKSSGESSSGARFFEIAVAVLITVMIVVGILKVKSYFDPIMRPNSYRGNIRGSTNTIQTTDGHIEMRGN